LGQEIDQYRFTEDDFNTYGQRLGQETELLARWFDSGRFATGPKTAGFELEAWLIDPQLHPAPVNESFMQAMASDLIAPELARFNVELNNLPQPLDGRGLERLERDMRGHWHRCQRTAADLDARLLMIGILPTLKPGDLTLRNMSPLNRYRALNQQVMRQREGRRLELDIAGREHLRMKQRSVMLESAATSFQVHLKVPLGEATRLFNASIIASAPLVAASANSPYLFGRDLWDETRIPLFEQAVEVGGYEGAARGPLRRVTFGSGYVQESLMECFRENLDHYPVLLPHLLEEPTDQLPHLRLQNGTIWRWNRPLIGFESDGTPHLRIEHRVIPGGPTITDSVANAAFYYGLAQGLALAEIPPERDFEFATARDNFYAAAQRGLEAQLRWIDGTRGNAQQLILDVLLPIAAAGLRELRVERAVAERYLGIIRERVAAGRTGTAWQRAFIARQGPDFFAMTRAYAERQDSGEPVHQWDF
jgi:gamma-glutamyl:cysteine ligase YbdK (ATP-grasp superfamily)